MTKSTKRLNKEEETEVKQFADAVKDNRKSGYNNLEATALMQSLFIKELSKRNRKKKNQSVKKK